MKHIPYIDMHCDTLWEAAVAPEVNFKTLPNAMVDLDRLKASQARAQFFALFLVNESHSEDAKYLGLDAMPPADELIEILHKPFLNTLAQYPADIAWAGNYTDLCSNSAQGKISAFLTIEDGFAAFGKLENIKRFYDLGVRLISLTWNEANCFGYPNSSDPNVMSRGLTDFGKEAVAYMNELGILVDVSHLSDGGFQDVAELSKKPFVASHSNCRALSPHRRNLTDDMLRVLADHGGVAGINFGPEFLSADPSSEDSRIEDMCRHLQHMVRVGGEDCAALGSDFDGIGGNLELGDCGRMQTLFQALDTYGFREGLIEKIAYRNVERVIRDAMK